MQNYVLYGSLDNYYLSDCMGRSREGVVSLVINKIPVVPQSFLHVTF